jgi:serine/threonine protein kinase
MSAQIVAKRYILTSWLGAGATGHVYSAHDQLLHRAVAVKRVQGASIRFALRGARMAAGLAHPGIIKIYNTFEERGSLWVVMALAEGSSLARVVWSSGGLSPALAAKMGTEVLGALAYAHGQHIVHGNLKPDNILLHRGHVVLTDFSGDENPGLDFVPPERLRRGTATELGDLWSVGAILLAAVGRDAGPLSPVIDGLMRETPADRMSAVTAMRLLRDRSVMNAVANS